jgi:hypothetical protein
MSTEREAAHSLTKRRWGVVAFPCNPPFSAFSCIALLQWFTVSRFVGETHAHFQAGTVL